MALPARPSHCMHACSKHAARLLAAVCLKTVRQQPRLSTIPCPAARASDYAAALTLQHAPTRCLPAARRRQHAPTASLGRVLAVQLPILFVLPSFFKALY